MERISNNHGWPTIAVTGDGYCWLYALLRGIGLDYETSEDLGVCNKMVSIMQEYVECGHCKQWITAEQVTWRSSFLQY